MRIRSFAAYANSRLPKRVKELRRIVGILDEKNPEGLDRDEAEQALTHFAPHFEDIHLYAQDGTWFLSVGYYVCPKCELNFDAKDAKSISREGTYCPQCGELVPKEEE